MKQIVPHTNSIIYMYVLIVILADIGSHVFWMTFDTGVAVFQGLGKQVHVMKDITISSSSFSSLSSSSLEESHIHQHGAIEHLRQILEGTCRVNNHHHRHHY